MSATATPVLQKNAINKNFTRNRLDIYNPAANNDGKTFTISLANIANTGYLDSLRRAKWLLLLYLGERN